MPERECPSIGADVVEAAAKVLEMGVDNLYRAKLEAAIAAADKARGLHEERKVRAAFVGPDDVEHPDELRVRLVTDWRPVDAEPPDRINLDAPYNELSKEDVGRPSSVRVDAEPNERHYIWVQTQVVGDLASWDLAVTRWGEQPWPLLIEAIIDGEDALGHDDFWVAEVSDTHLLAIWHANKERRNDAESDELAAVAAALGIQPSATSEGER
jgi:hypothetical protein